MQLPQLDLVLFTFGNASAVDHELSVFAIKPRGVPYNVFGSYHFISGSGIVRKILVGEKHLYTGFNIAVT